MKRLDFAVSERPPESVSLRLPGGPDAPRTARQFVQSEVDARLSGSIPASNAGLIVSELVTNSVRHAGVGSQELITVCLTMLEDRLRIAVSDPGSELEPQLVSIDATVPGGFGLQIVAGLALAWGVSHEPAGSTQVWCEIGLNGNRHGT